MQLSRKQLDSLAKQVQICTALEEGAKTFSELLLFLNWNKDGLDYPLKKLIARRYVRCDTTRSIQVYNLSSKKIFVRERVYMEMVRNHKKRMKMRAITTRSNHVGTK